jgi:hypothetical protein
MPAYARGRIPNFRFKLGAEYQVTNPWKVGADLNVVGSQWLVGDESNQNPKVPAYWVVNLHSSYKITDNVEVFGLVRNLFDQHYYVFGTFFDVTSFPYLNLTDPRTFIPGIPFAAYLGVRGTLPSPHLPTLRLQCSPRRRRSIGRGLRRGSSTGLESILASMRAIASGVAIGLIA